MKKQHSKFIALLILVLGIATSCSKDDDIVNELLNKEAKIISFEINSVLATITGTNISLTLPNGTDVTSLKAQVILSEGATIDPNPETLADYTISKQFTVTAEDGMTAEIYTISVTTEAVTPTAENPYPEGVFILRDVSHQNYELDFRHVTGSVSTNVFQSANNGQTISGIEISDIIPHDNGYLLLGNMFDNSGGRIIYTNLKLEVLKEETLEKCNVNGNRHARIGKKIYYTNISNLVEYNQPKNKTYVIDTETNTLEKFDNNQVLEFYASSNGELYFTDLIRGLYKVTDLDTQATTDLNVDFDDYTNSFVMDNNDVLWSISRTRSPQNFGEAQSLNLGTFDYKLNLIAYDTQTGTKTESVSTSDINRESNLYVANNNAVYLITNQNIHFANPKKELQRLYLDNTNVKLENTHDLPEPSTTIPLALTHDGNMYTFGSHTIMVKGGTNNTGYYYDLDLNSGITSNKIIGTSRLFERKVF